MTTQTLNSLRRILAIFKASGGVIKPHFILTSPSGSGKSHTIQCLVEAEELSLLEINAAALTKEGTSGNSVSKALSPLLQLGGKPVVVFVDEFDKLFISGNSNSSLAHETTNGVQNEFLKVLEGRASVFGDYGKYVNIVTDNVLFIFAGAFNGEENITLDRLREFGIKTEFLGRVGLAYGLPKVTLADMRNILEHSALLSMYLTLIPESSKEKAVEAIMEVLEEAYEKNTIGVRLVNTLLHQYFIQGSLKPSESKRLTFQKTLAMV